jgi:hypothetical protein
MCLANTLEHLGTRPLDEKNAVAADAEIEIGILLGETKLVSFVQHNAVELINEGEIVSESGVLMKPDAV